MGTVQGSITISSGGSDGIPIEGYLCDVADGLTCDSQTGACEALGNVGETCRGSSSCVPSAYCDFADSVCQARLAIGASCSGFDECVASAHCDSETSTCVALLEAGESCSTYSECASRNCTNQKCESSDDLGLVFLCGSN